MGWILFNFALAVFNGVLAYNTGSAFSWVVCGFCAGVGASLLLLTVLIGEH